MHDTQLTQRMKAMAMQWGADLVGVAPAERWAKAPLEHSPRGILPTARCAISCAVHIPDACMELASEEDPRKPGPGLVLVNLAVTMNSLAFRLANWLEGLGWPTIAAPQTLYWNYRTQPGASRGWKSDICSYYAATCAGLGEIGWHNLCITPEFGTRQRFVTIMTEAPLAPDPLYSGPPLCDHCNLCAANCPTQSFDKEVDGMCTIEIEDKKFTFPNRNLWRCGIGENFQLDVLMPWPDKVDEKVILERTEKAVFEHPEWIYGWIMGLCIKYCVNPQRRYFDKDYCKGPRRRRDVQVPEPTPDLVKRLTDEAMILARNEGADLFAAANLEDLTAGGVDLKDVLPDAAGAIILGFGYPENCELNTETIAYRGELETAHYLEKFGFSALLHSAISAEDVAAACGLAEKGPDGKTTAPGFGSRVVWKLVVTSLPLVATKHSRTEETAPAPERPSTRALTAQIKALALNQGGHLVGVAPADRLDRFADALAPLYADMTYFVVEDQPLDFAVPNEEETRAIWGGQAMPYNPKARDVKLFPKKPADYLKSAASVIVVAVRLPHASIDWVGKGPGKKAGHYAGVTHEEAVNQLMFPARAIARRLDELGYNVAVASDLTGLASRLYSPEAPDLASNRFAAVAAGLGEIGWNGLAMTPEYGARQRFIALVTDAPLVADPLYRGPSLCRRCGACAKECPAKALSETNSVGIDVEGKRFEWAAMDRLRCDWVKRYALLAAGGPVFAGSVTDFPIPDAITPEAVCDAVRRSDRFQRPGYTAIVERCFTECPVTEYSQASQEMEKSDG